MSVTAQPNAEQANERQQLLAYLRESRERFLKAAAAVADELSRIKPGEGRWSVLECVEHVVTAEQQMLLNVERRRRPADGEPDYEKDAVIQGVAENRASKRSAPEAASPSGKFASLARAMGEFRSARERTLAYVEGQKDDLRKFTVMHPLAGVIDTYQALAIMAAHAERHAQQIEEIRNSAAYRAAQGK